LSRELNAAGFRVSEAESAAHLMAALGEGARTDLLVLDPDLPDADSGDLLARLERAFPDLPVVLHTFLYEINTLGRVLSWTAATVEKGANSSDALIREVTRLLATATPPAQADRAEGGAMDQRDGPEGGGGGGCR
jgi:DNA-binding NtrC family response regulator